jgi:subtilisin family serine protease
MSKLTKDRYGVSGQGVQVCITDDGVQYTHPDLAVNYVAVDSYLFLVCMLERFDINYI